MSTEKLPYIVSAALLTGLQTPASADMYQQPEPPISADAPLQQSTRDIAPQNPFRTTNPASPFGLTSALESHIPRYVIDPSADVSQPAPADIPVAATTTTVTVEPGDTVVDIAARTGISPLQLEATNDLEDPDHIEVGDQLSIVPASDEEIDTYQQHQAERLATREADNNSSTMAAITASSDNPNSPDMSAAVTPDGGGSQLNQVSSQTDSMASMNMGPSPGPKSASVEQLANYADSVVYNTEAPDLTELSRRIMAFAAELASEEGMEYASLPPGDKLIFANSALEEVEERMRDIEFDWMKFLHEIRTKMLAVVLSDPSIPPIVRLDYTINGERLMQLEGYTSLGYDNTRTPEQRIDRSRIRLYTDVDFALKKAKGVISDYSDDNPADYEGVREQLRHVLDTVVLFDTLSTDTKEQLVRYAITNSWNDDLRSKVIEVRLGEIHELDLVYWLADENKRLASYRVDSRAKAQQASVGPVATDEPRLVMLEKAQSTDTSLYEFIRRVLNKPDMSGADLVAARDAILAVNPGLTPETLIAGKSYNVPDSLFSGNMQPSPGPEQGIQSMIADLDRIKIEYASDPIMGENKANARIVQLAAERAVAHGIDINTDPVSRLKYMVQIETEISEVTDRSAYPVDLDQDGNIYGPYTHELMDIFLRVEFVPKMVNMAVAASGGTLEGLEEYYRGRYVKAVADNLREVVMTASDDDDSLELAMDKEIFASLDATLGYEEFKLMIDELRAGSLSIQGVAPQLAAHIVEHKPFSVQDMMSRNMQPSPGPEQNMAAIAQEIRDSLHADTEVFRQQAFEQVMELAEVRANQHNIDFGDPVNRAVYVAQIIDELRETTDEDISVEDLGTLRSHFAHELVVGNPAFGEYAQAYMRSYGFDAFYAQVFKENFDVNGKPDDELYRQDMVAAIGFSYDATLTRYENFLYNGFVTTGDEVARIIREDPYFATLPEEVVAVIQRYLEGDKGPNPLKIAMSEWVVGHISEEQLIESINTTLGLSSEDDSSAIRADHSYDPSQAPGQAPQVTVDTTAGGDGNNTTDTAADTTAGGSGVSPFDPSTMNPEGTPASVATPDTSTLSTPNIQATPGLSVNSENTSDDAMAFSDGPVPASTQPVRVEASLSQAVASHQGTENSSSQPLTIDQIMDIIKRDGVTIEAMNTWFPGGRGPDPMTVMATGEYIRTHQAEIHRQMAQIDAQYRTASPDDSGRTEWMLSSSNLEYYLNMYNHSGSAGERIAAVIAIIAIAGGTIALSG